MTAFLFIIAGILFLAAVVFFVFVNKPTPSQQVLSEKIAHFTSIDPNESIASHGARRIRTDAFNSAAAPNLEAAKNMTALSEEHEKAVFSEATGKARLENSLLTLENQNELLFRATAAGVTP